MTKPCRYCGRELRPYGDLLWCPDRVHCRHAEHVHDQFTWARLTYPWTERSR